MIVHALCNHTNAIKTISFKRRMQGYNLFNWLFMARVTIYTWLNWGHLLNKKSKYHSDWRMAKVSLVSFLLVLTIFASGIISLYLFLNFIRLPSDSFSFSFFRRVTMAKSFYDFWAPICILFLLTLTFISQHIEDVLFFFLDLKDFIPWYLYKCIFFMWNMQSTLLWPRWTQQDVKNTWIMVAATYLLVKNNALRKRMEKDNVFLIQTCLITHVYASIIADRENSMSWIKIWF